MPYSSQADLIEQLSEAELIELTDDTGNGVVDESVVNRAIADADAEIDSYSGTRYTLPFSPVPTMIRKLSVDLAIYNLFTRRSLLKMPEERQHRYDNAIRFLKDISKGVVSLGSDAPSEPAVGLPQSTRTKDDRVFSLGKVSEGSIGTLDNY